MRKFHIVYKISEADFYSKGENVEAQHIMLAINNFLHQHKEGVIIIAVYDLDAVHALYINAETKPNYKQEF